MLNLRVYFLLFFIFCLGVITSYTDIKKQQIKNKHILFALLIGLLINISFFKLNFLINYAINILFALLVGFLLWYIHFWNAGDGKLFLAFVALLPISLLYKSNFYLFSYDVIFYTFVPVFFVLVALLFTKSRIKELVDAFKRSFKPKVVFNIFVAFFSFSWIMGMVTKTIGISLNMFIAILVLFFVFEGLERVSRIKLVYILYVAFLLRILFDYKTIITANFVLTFFINFFVFLFVVYFILYLAYFKYAKPIKIQDLSPGMLLSEPVAKRGDKYVTMPNIKISLFSFLRARVKEKAFIGAKPGGLTAEEIETLKELKKEGKLSFGSVLVQARLPYAPFQFLGAAIVIAKVLYPIIF